LSVARSLPESSIDYDGAWKEALELYLEPFLRLCFPIVHAGIDWNHLPIPLDKELQEIVRDAQTGRRHVDKLFRVVRRDGVEEWLLIHIEVQSQPDPRLSERMYRYHHRIGDRYDRPVVSLAVLADRTPRFRPGVYEVETWGCRVRFEYPTCKLLDLGDELLEGQDNPAAIVIAAHRAAQRLARDPASRKMAKWQLTRRLYERGYTKEQILNLYRLIDWLIQLPEELKIEFRDQVAEYEEQQRMPYITSIEELGRKGRQEGWPIIRTPNDAVVDALEIRFGQVPDACRQAILAIRDEDRLRTLLQAAIQSGSIDDFVRVL
jgi:hypothetical protein